MHWLETLLGLKGSGNWYGFWSGFGSDVAEFAIVGALYASVRKHNCHVHGCWRVGRLPVDGTAWTVCRKHHPDNPPRAEQLQRL